MPTLKIDNQVLEVPEGTTLLEAARTLGIEIPTLCFIRELNPQTSCMVCMVKVINEEKFVEDEPGVFVGKFVPACATKAEEGMVVQSETGEVHAVRTAALELLLGDHLGDCEAPCRLAHPKYMNIPELLRLTMAGEFQQAADLLADHPAMDGKNPYEKACRRGRVDEPIAIDRVIAFLRTVAAAPAYDETRPAPPRPWTVSMPLPKGNAFSRYVANAADGGQVSPAGATYTPQEAMREASRCLHCDCRKPHACRLRLWSNVYQARAGRFRKPHREYALVNFGAGLLFEPGKCIQCGLCIQAAGRLGLHSRGVSFLGRGFEMHVGPPFDEGQAVTDPAAARKLADVCPTAALCWEEPKEYFR